MLLRQRRPIRPGFFYVGLKVARYLPKVQGECFNGVFCGRLPNEHSNVPRSNESLLKPRPHAVKNFVEAN